MRLINGVSNRWLMNWNFSWSQGLKTSLCILHNSTLSSSICLTYRTHGFRFTGFCVFSLQFRVFGSGQASGQGVCGRLYSGGHSLRRTPRRGKKKNPNTHILSLIKCFCFSNKVKPCVCWEKNLITVKCHKQQLWHRAKRKISEAFLWTSHSVTIIRITMTKYVHPHRRWIACRVRPDFSTTKASSFIVGMELDDVGLPRHS